MPLIAQKLASQNLFAKNDFFFYNLQHNSFLTIFLKLKTATTRKKLEDDDFNYTENRWTNDLNQIRKLFLIFNFEPAHGWHEEYNASQNSNNFIVWVKI